MYKEGAVHGDPRCQREYGLALYYGEGVREDEPEGLVMLKQAADQHDGKACLELGERVPGCVAPSRDPSQRPHAPTSGRIYREFQHDPAAAELYFLRAVEQGEKNAWFGLGALEHAKRRAKAREHWTKGSRLGDADCQYWLGREVFFENKLYVEGMQLWEQASEQGYLMAKYCLALTLYPGTEERTHYPGLEDAVPADPARAVKLFHDALEGWADAEKHEHEVCATLYYLGLAYANGKGVKQSWDTAVNYWKKVR